MAIESGNGRSSEDPEEHSCEEENQGAMVGELTKLEDALKRDGCWKVNEDNALRTERYSVVYESIGIFIWCLTLNIRYQHVSRTHISVVHCLILLQQSRKVTY